MMFMSERDLPPYGKALAWGIAAGAWATVICGSAAVFAWISNF